MRKKLGNISIKISLLIIVICSQLFSVWAGESLKLYLEEVLSIGRLNDVLLFQWVAVVADSSGCYVTDTMDYSIKHFDEEGNLIKKTGRKGQGPGEFIAIRFLGISENFLYATDQYMPGIQVFDKDLNYKKRIPILIPVSDIKVISDDEIAVASLSADEGKKGRISIFNQDGETVREIKYLDKKIPFMLDMVSFDLDPKGNLYLAYTFQDKIQKFNPEGKKLWSKGLLDVKKIEMQKIRSFKVPSQLIYKDVALDSSGHLFVLGGSYSKNPSQDVYVLSPEGKLLTTFMLPDTTHCIHIDSQDYLYSRANEGVTLKKYKMKYIN
ncbi:MAG: 6-bladed beta-propeller [Candidatus Aminicenantes bacterium]|nr:MAG: 6-bladed beta-propeller [Candidatus Aminicenantes bacterium]